MSINLIPNQVYNFKNIADPKPCECEGRSFVRKVNKNDTCQIEFNSTIINSNADFDQSLDNWVLVKNGAFINPYSTYFTANIMLMKIVVSWPASPYILTNQYEFSIDNGLTYYNETTKPSLEFTGLLAGTYKCIIKDTLTGTSSRTEIIL